MTAQTAPPSEWIWSHYKLGERPMDGTPPPFVCIRCHSEVDWLTKHAVERHGDADVQVAPPTRPAPEGGWKW